MQQRIAKALGEDVVNHTPNKYSLPQFAEFVKIERKIFLNKLKVKPNDDSLRLEGALMLAAISSDIEHELETFITDNQEEG